MNALVTPARPRRLLLVAGARALLEQPAAELWARALLADALEELGADGVVLAGGAPGPDAWAVEQARARGLKRLELRLDGGRYEDERLVRRWIEDAARLAFDPKRWPLHRNQELVALACRARAAGWEVRVLALYAPWSATRGTAHTAGHARAQGLDVVEATFEEAAAPDARLPAVWIDTETGGRNARFDPLIEIGAVLADASHARALGTFESKLAVPAGMVVQADAARINGYTAHAWLGAPAADVALRALLAWLPPRFTLCGYNVAFDRGFLRAYCARYGYAEPGWLPDAVDPMYTARKVLKRTAALKSAKLDEVCRHYGVPSPARHRALADAERARLVHLALLAKRPTCSIFDEGWTPAGAHA